MGVAMPWLVLLMAVAAVFIYPYISSFSSPTTTSSSSPLSPTELKRYTLEEVALHNKKDDLWLIIDAEVYDMTDFYPKHPGGAEMLRGAGRDATALFSGHSAIAKSMRSKYLIGRLKREGDDKPIARNLWEIETRFLNGSQVSLSNWKGKVVMIVNVASQCGFTPQYTALQELHSRFSDKGFTVIGVPSNNFGEQEPGDEDDIQAFVSNYQVTFPLLEKMDITRSPLYHFLSLSVGAPEWNFYKYIVGKDGLVKRRFPSEVEPISDPILRVVEYYLRAPNAT